MRAAALAFTLLLAGAMLPPAVGARDCRGETPLPVDLKIVPPAAHVPTALADLVGAWGGTWTARGQEGECTVLVVEEVYPNGYARGVYSVGIANPPGNSTPDYFRVAGRITDGTLRFSLPVPWPAAFAYRLDVDRLLGTFGADVAEVILTRVPDRAALECGAAYRAPVAPPGVARDRLTAAELLAPPDASRRPVHHDYFLPL